MLGRRSARISFLALMLAGAVAGCGSGGLEQAPSPAPGGPPPVGSDGPGLGGAEVRQCNLGGADSSCQVCQTQDQPACCPMTNPAGCGSVASMQQFSQCQGDNAGQLCLVPTAAGPSTLIMTNTTANPTTVFMNFAAEGGACPASNPPTQPEDVPFCTVTVPWTAAGGGSCTFTLDAVGGANASRTFPNITGKCLSGTFSFDEAVSCASPSGVTGAEYSLNVGSFQQTLNISLVNGWNHDIQMVINSPGGGMSTLGPTTGVNTTGLVGVYPNGCDVCQSRQAPPCQSLYPDLTPGSSNGCNPSGTPCQYNPVPAGSTVEVQLLD